MSKAMALLQEKIAGGQTRAAIGLDIGYSHTAVSLYLNGKYGAQVAKLEAAILRIYDRRICPEDGMEKRPVQCQRIALAPRPHGFPDAEALWHTCQTCPHKPTTEPEGKK
jgi:DNA transposition AAA+ family ATPase